MKKLSLAICLVLVLSLFMGGCGTSQDVGKEDNTQENPEGVLVKSSMELKYTSDFSVEYLEDGSKLITDGMDRQLLLVQRGEKIPAGYEKTPAVHIPVEKVIITTETQGSMLEPSEGINTVVGYTENVNDWYIEELKENIEKGQVAFLGGGESPDYEKIKELAPDLILLDAGFQQIGDKLDSLGIPYIIDSSDWEADPMARMEWIKLFATLYNKEEDVIAYFDKGDEKLKEIEDRVKGLDKPKVSWGFLITGKAFVPYAGSYVGKHIELSGGDYIYKEIGPDKTHTATITMEEFYTGGRLSDVYISSGPPAYNTSTQDIIDRGLPIMKDMKPLVEDNTWCYQPWYYQVVHETPEVIEELQAILYPELYPDYKEFKYYWKVPLAE